MTTYLRNICNLSKGNLPLCKITITEISGNVGLVVLTSMAMEIFLFQDITQRSLMKANRRFAGKFRLVVQQVRTQPTGYKTYPSHIRFSLLPECFTLSLCITSSSSLKIDATSSSETSTFTVLSQKTEQFAGNIDYKLRGFQLNGSKCKILEFGM